LDAKNIYGGFSQGRYFSYETNSLRLKPNITYTTYPSLKAWVILSNGVFKGLKIFALQFIVSAIINLSKSPTKTSQQ